MNFFLNLEKNAVTLTVLRFCSLLPETVVLSNIHSIEYFAQITQDTMKTADYLLLYIVVIAIVYCSVGVMMDVYG